MPSLPPVVAELTARTSEFMARMGEARGEVAKMGDSSSHFAKLKAVGGAALLGLAGTAVAVGGAALEMADRYEKAHASLEAALTASGHSFAQFKPQIGAVSKQMEQFGFTNAQTEEALAHATVAMQDPTKALKEMGLAADLARFKHVDLAEATDVVDKALAGNMRGLKQMGIDLPIAATNALKLQKAQEALAKAHEGVSAVLAKHADAVQAGSKYHDQYVKATEKVKAAEQSLADQQSAHTQIIDALSQRLGGQASTYAETFAGKMDRLKATSEDLGKNLGLRLIPVIEKVASATLVAVQWIEREWPKVKAVIGAVVNWFENSALPVFVSVGNGIMKAFNVVKAVALDVWPTVKDIIQTFVDYISGLVRIVSDIFHGKFGKAFHDFKDMVVKVLGDVLKVIGDLPGLILKALGNLGELLVHAGEDLIKGLIKGIGHMASSVPGAIASAIPGGGLIKGGIGAVTSLFHAAGGLFTNPTLGIIGEAGPELLLPLNDPSRSAALVAQANSMGLLGGRGSDLVLPSSSGGASSVGSASSTVSVAQGAITVVAQPGQNPNQIADAVLQRFLRLVRNNRGSASPLGLT